MQIGRPSLRSVLVVVASVVTTSLVTWASPVRADPPHPVVNTDNGPVRGLLNGHTREFLGIPYAAPPAGARRWRPPQPAASWQHEDGPFDATSFGNRCPQTADLFDPASDNEDCLNLNVYVPGPITRAPHHRRPVMVWLHGGGFHHGASEDYDPQELAEMGDVVVVSVNYRLGMLGFLSHPALTAESPDSASGNYGLMDQQAALRWVQRNIDRFGGDADNVTIFGESAGGVSVHAQLASPGAAGLFDRAIAQSGAYTLTQPTLAEAEDQGESFATVTGCDSQTIACLRAVPVQTILDNQGAFFPFSALPTVDGAVLPHSVKDAFASGAFNHVPVIEGSNHDEWAAFVAIIELVTGAPLNAADYVAAISTLPTNGSTFPPAQDIADGYPIADYEDSPSLALAAAGTAGVFACPALKATQLMSQYTPTYHYEFSDPDAPSYLLPPVSFDIGAWHSSELPYLFNYIGLVLVPPVLDAAQQQLSDTMIGYWTRFARTGNPNFAGAPAWPSYDVAQQFQSLVPSAIATRNDFAADHRCGVWD
jgi:para-nitrobenzyl esterase